MNTDQPENHDRSSSGIPNEPAHPTKDQGSAAEYRFPKKTILITGLVALVILLTQVFKSELEDAISLSPDVLSVCTWLATMLIILAWMIWILCLSGRPWSQRIIMFALLFAVPYGLLKILNPVNNGDMGIARFEPIWLKNKVVESNVETPSIKIDLTTETPNDFTGFLGNERNGSLSQQANLADDAIGDQTEQLWKQEVGAGWSGFAARNGFAVTLEQRGEFECAVCYEIKTGKIQWLQKTKIRHRDAMGIGGIGPRSTPTIHEGKVYTIGGMGHVNCLDGSTGEPIWQQQVLDILGIDTITKHRDGFDYHFEDSTLAWGRAGSPLVIDDLVIVPGGGARGATEYHTLLAFDKNTGELKWKGGDQMIAYGSPSSATLAGKKQILIVSESQAISVDPVDGRQLWSHARPGSSEGPANCSQVTFLDSQTLLLSKGYNMGGELLEITLENDEWIVNSLEVNPRALKTKLTNPVILDGYSYSLSDGFLECADIEDLSRQWKHRGQFGHGQVLLCGDKLLVHSESGTLYLVKATPDGYEELGRMKTIKGVCWNTICRYGEFILVRSELEAACYRVKEE